MFNHIFARKALPVEILCNLLGMRGKPGCVPLVSAGVLFLTRNKYFHKLDHAILSCNRWTKWDGKKIHLTVLMVVEVTPLHKFSFRIQEKTIIFYYIHTDCWNMAMAKRDGNFPSPLSVPLTHMWQGFSSSSSNFLVASCKWAATGGRPLVGRLHSSVARVCGARRRRARGAGRVGVARLKVTHVSSKPVDWPQVLILIHQSESCFIRTWRKSGFEWRGSAHYQWRAPGSQLYTKSSSESWVDASARIK